MAGSSVKSQTDFVRESLFRANGFGVTNHKFDVCLLITNQSSEWYCYDSPYITGNCFNEIYEGEWDDLENGRTYALRVYPWSVCDHEDYVNGVATADLIDIGWHIRDTILITDPYMMVSADATGDKQIDTYDIISIRDVILGNTTGFMNGSNLGRTSWEWWNANDIAGNSYFDSLPWNYTINEDWPGGRIFGGLSKSDLEDENNHPDWFDYRTTKVGDIRSHSTPASTNSWVCGTYSFKNTSFETRQSSSELFDLIPSRRIEAGDEFELSFNILSSENLIGFQIPFYLDKIFEVIAVQNDPDFPLFWNHAQQLKFFMALWYTTDGNTKKTNRENAILKIRLRALKDIENLREYLSRPVTQNVELIDLQGIHMDAKIRANLLNYFPVRFNAYYKTASRVLQLFSEGSQQIDVEQYSITGQLIFKDRIVIEKGISEYALYNNSPTSLSIIKLSNGKTNKVLKAY